MSIDSIESQRRLFEEQRAREIGRIERERKDEIARIENEKIREVKKIAEDQQNEVAKKTSDADFIVSRAEEAANNRIKDYESQVSRLTDDAKRQFQAKAALLQKNAEEIEVQRGHLLKQHDESLKALHNQHENKMTEDKLKLQREANQTYMAQLNNIRDVEDRGKFELNLAHQETMNQKEAERIEGQREIGKLQSERDLQRSLIQNEITSDKNSASQQIENVRIKQEMNQRELEGKYEDQVSQIKRSKMNDINRQHIQGKRQEGEVAEFYTTQIDQLTKDGRQKTRDIQNHNSYNLAGMEQEAKTQEQFAKKNYEIQKNLRIEERDKTLEQFKSENEKIREQQMANYKSQSMALKKEKEDLMVAQTDQFKGELAVQKQLGLKQVNDRRIANAETLAAHDSKEGDPFYHRQSINPEISDLEKELVIKIRVPAHEQEQIRITDQDGKIAISGNRKYETKAQTESGGKVTTNSFQSFSETFPIAGKVQFKQMVRSYDNGTLTFRIPKF